ncbi:hypothetical protein VC83_03572 [Pseudogymnoascus destructans]|uniref:Ribophorin II C-terminal domain-containing protein n=1 Tax=Pseudogymnoascus destructans TaxID=655981 RepID=A0A177AEM0_9PEZI|nr:uncharacterized protein VC83_03572 [Pseudogymnoascus destructans]OAF60555.1 hypothetical protein VC83_03572 [Pseudogymnoascus destructans]
MRFLHLLPSLLLAGTALAAEKPWSFKDATVSVIGKGSRTSKESLSPSKPLAQPLALGRAGTLKLSLTTTSTTPSRPHQAFLTLTDPTTGLSTSFALQTRTTGAATLDLPYASLPSALLSSPSLSASLVLGSFGSVPASETRLFNIALSADEGLAQVEKPPMRYGKLAEIHHIFVPEQSSPPRVISVFFTLAVLATLPVVLGAWALAGGNAGHVGAALAAAPVSHGLFFGSLVAMEGVFAMYYVSWRLFEVLPLAGVVGAVTFVSGSKALSEVQARRVRGRGEGGEVKGER